MPVPRTSHRREKTTNRISCPNLTMIPLLQMVVFALGYKLSRASCYTSIHGMPAITTLHYSIN